MKSENEFIRKHAGFSYAIDQSYENTTYKSKVTSHFLTNGLKMSWTPPLALALPLPLGSTLPIRFDHFLYLSAVHLVGINRVH